MENSENRSVKKTLRSDISRISLAIIVNTVIMAAVSVIGMIVRLVTAALGSGDPDVMGKLGELIESADFWTGVTKSGVEYLIFSVLGTLSVYLIMKKRVPLKRVFGNSGTMNAGTFFKFVCVFMGIQLPTILVNTAAELGLNQLGFTAERGMEAATSESLTVSMFLYSSLIGPIVEELIYRGFAMRALEKYGKAFAVVMSSVFFGVMHQNLVQSIFAVGAGLVLGYVAMNYSIKWSILLHIINNCLFGDVLSRAIADLPEAVQDAVIWGVLGAFFVLACVILITERKKVAETVKSCFDEKRYYLYALGSVWFLVFFIGSVILGFQVIERI